MDQIQQVDFKDMETKILSQVMEVSKAMIESFEFRMIYGVNVTKEQNKATLKHLKDFREKNWDASVSRNKAYRKYMALY